MARYTTQVELAFNSLKEYRSIVPDTGASVAVEAWSGVGWTVDAASPVTAPEIVFTQNVKLRLTPTGGGFFIDEEGLL